MKYALLLLLIIACPSFAMDGLYQLPSTKKIEKRLNGAGLNHFACQSKIADAIGDRFFKLIFLHSYVKSEILKYNSSMREWTYKSYKDNKFNSTQPTVSNLMELLLQDHPRALTALEKNYDGAFLR